MYEVYQHKMRPQYRLIKSRDAPMPAEAGDNFKLARMTDQISPEAEQAIKDRGFHLYKIVVKFQEIEGEAP